MHVRWRTVDAGGASLELPAWRGQAGRKFPYPSNPVEFFRYFIRPKLLEDIVETSNSYARKKEIGFTLTVPLLQRFIGSCLLSSLQKLPRIRMHWGRKTRTSLASVLPRKLWERIASVLHFSEDRNPNDSIEKVRPLLAALKNRFQSVPLTRKLAVDEGMVPHKGRCKLKKYEPRKPHKWGFRLYMICGADGFLHNVEVCGEPVPKTQSGKAKEIVLRLASIVPSNQNFLVYFDRWYTTLDLVYALAKKGIYSTGTIMPNRTRGCKFPTDAELGKRGRGAYEERMAVVNGVELRLSKYLDRKGVFMLTTAMSGRPFGEAERWCRKQKAKVKVPVPRTILDYNASMHPVDSHNSYVSLYRTTIRNKRWYVKFFFYLMDTVVVNAWLLYCRKCRDEKTKPAPLLNFKMDIANGLVRNSANRAAVPRQKPQEPRAATPPGNAVHHLPDYVEKKARCRYDKCGRTTFVRCKTCRLALCFTRARNHFAQYHERPGLDG